MEARQIAAAMNSPKKRKAALTYNWPIQCPMPPPPINDGNGGYSPHGLSKQRHKGIAIKRHSAR